MNPIEQFDNRREEVRSYLSFLNILDVPLTQGRQKKVKEDGFIICKASAFILLYNVIESSIKESFILLYKQINSQNHSYTDLIDELQSQWLEHLFKTLLLNPCTSNNTYKNKAKAIICDIIEAEAISIPKEALPISGNLDYDSIFSLCRNFKITASFTDDDLPRHLTTIKKQRNNLSHGTFSFIEIGRDYTVKDLEEISRFALKFTRVLLKKIKLYTEKELYKK